MVPFPILEVKEIQNKYKRNIFIYIQYFVMDPRCIQIIAVLIAIILFLLFKDYVCGTLVGKVLCPLVKVSVDFLMKTFKFLF
jgi:hypothetical protein